MKVTETAEMAKIQKPFAASTGNPDKIVHNGLESLLPFV